MAILGEMVPENKLVFAWKIAKSGRASMNPSRLGAASWKPLKSMAAIVRVVLLSGGFSQ